MTASRIAYVTGGSGFLGRNLIRALRDRGWQVHALARSPNAQAVVRGAGAEPAPGDLSSVAQLERGMSRCEVVFHCAALADDWGRRDRFYDANVRGTENVLAAAERAGVKTVVHVSTEAVLADGTPIRKADESRAASERAVGVYPWSKALAERVALSPRPSGLKVVVVRPRLIWGKGDTTLLPKLIATVLDGRFAWIGGGRYPTSTCHVENVCEGMILAAEKGRAGETYFLTDGEPVEFRGFVTRMLLSQGIEPGGKTVSRALVLWLARAFELVYRLTRARKAPPVTVTAVLLAGEEVTVSDAKARRELGYVGLKSREQGLTEMRAR